MSEGQIKKNIAIFYIAEFAKATLLFQTVVWFSYESKFLTGEQIAFFGAMIVIVEVLSQIPTGAFADIFGKKSAIIIGNLFSLIGFSLFALFPSVSIMIIFTICYGISNAFTSGTYSAMLYEVLQNAGKGDLYPRIKANGSLMFQFSGAVFLMLGGYLYVIASFLPYLCVMFGFLVGAINAFYLHEVHLDKSKFNYKAFIKQNVDGFREIFKSSYVSRLTIAYVLIGGIAFGSQRFLVVPYMSELGLGEVEKGWTAMIVKLSVSLFGFWLIRNKKFFMNKYFILIIPLVMVIVLMPIKYFTLPISMVFLLGIGFASANADLFMSPLINSNLESRVRTTALSAQYMLIAIVYAILQICSASFIANNRVGDFYQLLGIFTVVIIIPLVISLIHKGKPVEPDISLVGE